MSAPAYEATRQARKPDEILGPWKKRKKASLRARKPFEGRWMQNQAFAAGNQYVRWSEGDHRVIDIKRTLAEQGRSTAEADVLTQYLWTAVGKFAKDDFRPQLLFQHDDEEGEDYAAGANKAFGWGWDEEWHGDETCLDLLRTLVTFGTGAIRCRYDRSKGMLLGDVPHPAEDYSHTDPETGQKTVHKAGKPIMDPAAARAYMGEAKYYGEDVKLATLHEGAVAWELLTPWNLLPPPGIESARNFPWHLIVRPVHLDELRQSYPDTGQDVRADEIEAMNMLGLKDLSTQGEGGGSAGKLEEHALVYTGYELPCRDYPRGATVVFSQDDHLLSVEETMPYSEVPHGPRPGLTYFHYWKVKQRFWGRALVEAGIGPQRTRNKRRSQQDEIIDRALPKVYAEEGSLEPPSGLALEQVNLKPGAPKPIIDQGVGPGTWMQADIEQCDVDIEKALGLHAVSIGQTSPAGAPYARMALESENDADKLDPIAKDIKLGIAELSRDSLEAMRQWPDGKQLLIAGEEDRLESFVFTHSTIPGAFMVKPPKGSALPRSQGAELQKITDLWNAASQSQVVLHDPVAWLEWYQRSLDAGKAEELPAQSLVDQQRRQAALENIVMSRTGQVLPVTPTDNAEVHVAEHTLHLDELTMAAEAGDQQAATLAQVLDQHRQMHLLAQQQMAAQMPAAPPPGPPASPSQPIPPQ